MSLAADFDKDPQRASEKLALSLISQPHQAGEVLAHLRYQCSSPGQYSLLDEHISLIVSALRTCSDPMKAIAEMVDWILSNSPDRIGQFSVLAMGCGIRHLDNNFLAHVWNSIPRSCQERVFNAIPVRLDDKPVLPALFPLVHLVLENLVQLQSIPKGYPRLELLNRMMAWGGKELILSIPKENIQRLSQAINKEDLDHHPTIRQVVYWYRLGELASSTHHPDEVFPKL